MQRPTPRLQDHEHAVLAATKAIQLDTDYSKARRRLADSLFALGRLVPTKAAVQALRLLS